MERNKNIIIKKEENKGKTVYNISLLNILSGLSRLFGRNSHMLYKV